MKNVIGSRLVEIAALRVEALRRLVVLAPADPSCDLVRAQLAEAERLLRYRLCKFSEHRPRAGDPERLAKAERPAKAERAGGS